MIIKRRSKTLDFFKSHLVQAADSPTDAQARLCGEKSGACPSMA